MTKSVLMITSTASMIAQFNMNNIRILQALGYQVHVATNFVQAGTINAAAAQELKTKLKQINVETYQIDFQRGVGTPASLKTEMRQLSQIVQHQHFEFIHCQSPIGGVCGRLLGHKYHLKVLYTAHGFQFFKGGPKKDWFLFYPVERYLAHYTDRIITINHEDFQIAKQFPHTAVDYIPGVGIDYDRITSVKRDRQTQLKLRRALAIPEDALVIFSIGELSTRKNHQVIIKALAELQRTDIYYLICGLGDQKNNLLNLAKQLKVAERVKLLGYRNDIDQLLQVADISAFPSRREGLGLAGIEAMAAGLPLLSSNVQGIKDYSIDGQTGFVYDPLDVKGFADGIQQLADNRDLRMQMGQNNIGRVRKFDIKNINQRMKTIYEKM